MSPPDRQTPIQAVVWMASGAQGHTTQTITTPNEALNAVLANLKAGPHIDRTTLKRIPPALLIAVEVTVAPASP